MDARSGIIWSYPFHSNDVCWCLMFDVTHFPWNRPRSSLPLFAKSSAMYLPIPPFPPVIIATLSSSFNWLVHLAPRKYCLFDKEHIVHKYYIWHWCCSLLVCLKIFLVFDCLNNLLDRLWYAQTPKMSVRVTKLL